MMKVIIALVAALLVGGSGCAAIVEATSEKDSNAQALVEWVRSKGGFFNTKLQIQPRADDPLHAHSDMLGIYASQYIAKGNPLMIIPKSTFITSRGSNNICDTARALVQEYDSSSDFWPYTRYTFSTYPSLQLPSSWSDAGKNLFQTIVGTELNPWNITKISYAKSCKRSLSGNLDAELLEQAYQMAIARSWLDKMIPLYDMINHRSHKDYQSDTWSNVETNSAHRGRDVVVVASRDIQAGEELKYAFHECPDCTKKGKDAYSVLHMLGKTGHLQEYPRRWSIQYDPGNIIGFDLEKLPKEEVTNHDDDEPQLFRITSFSDEIASKHHVDLLGFLRAHLQRLADLHATVHQQATNELQVPHERHLLLDFYEGLTTAIEQAMLYTLEKYRNGNETTPTTTMTERYDNLTKRSTPRTNVEVCVHGQNGDSYEFESFPIVHTTQSQHQKIKFISHKGLDDTCLLLNDKLLSDGLHTCISYTAHYHENLVHLPARYAKQVKRVLFVGGGDSVMLREFLKYPELELAVGLELDQQVLRSSFLHFGAQPQFSNEKIQWWFGDATKSILMLPQEWYGTFDLVILDVLNDIWEKLPVTEDMGFIDAAMLLLNEHGVIGINEDDLLRPSAVSAFADYTVALYDNDVPVICEQHVYMLSDHVDFLKETPLDHKVDTLVLPPVLNDDGTVHVPFYNWYEYISNTTRPNKPCPQPGTKEKRMNKDVASHGVLMVLEAENVTKPLKPFYDLQSRISQTIKDLGLTEISTALTTWKENGRDGDELIFVLGEGYIAIRTWPRHQYCAMDVQLWGAAANLHEKVKDALLATVGSEAPSSFRLLTGGMHGTAVNNENKFGHIGPRVTGSCVANHEEEGLATHEDDDDDKTVAQDDGQVSTILSEALSLTQEARTPFLILCGDASTSCPSIEAINNVNAGEDVAAKAIPVWACSTGGEDAPSTEAMVACEADVHETIKETVKTNGKIAGIFIDSNAPKFMGQILHKLVGTSFFRRDLIVDKVLVVGILQSPTDAWRRELVSRFRTQFDKFNPAHQAEVHFESTKSSMMELVIFSSGDAKFFSHLTEFTERLQKSSGILGQVKSVENGIMSYIPEFEASYIGNHRSYDQRPSLEQWMSQQPLSYQTIFQFDVKEQPEDISVGDRVWVYRKSEWQKGRVVKQKDDGSFSVRLESNGNKRVVAPANNVRKILKKSEQKEEPIMPPSQFRAALHDALKQMDRFGFPNADTVLHTDLGEGSLIVSFWSQGSVILSWNGKSHVDVNLFTYDQSKLTTTNFEKFFLDRVPFLKRSLRDEQPRGIGGVVNSQEELGSRSSSTPYWAADLF